MNDAAEPIAVPPQPSLVLKVLACLLIVGCLIVSGLLLGAVLDQHQEYLEFYAAMYAVIFLWFAAQQYFAVFRSHPGAAGIAGMVQLGFAAIILVPTAFNLGAWILEWAEFVPHLGIVLGVMASFGSLLGWCGYLNLKWQARVVLARKKGQITNSDWQFSFRELILGVTVMAAVLGVAMWQARGRS